MAIERTAYCDLCGEEIKEDDSDNVQAWEDYTVSLGQMAGDSDIDLYKHLCKDCAKLVYDKLQKLKWEN